MDLRSKLRELRDVAATELEKERAENSTHHYQLYVGLIDALLDGIGGRRDPTPQNGPEQSTPVANDLPTASEPASPAAAVPEHVPIPEEETTDEGPHT